MINLGDYDLVYDPAPLPPGKYPCTIKRDCGGNYYTDIISFGKRTRITLHRKEPAPNKNMETEK